jgi:hypothetical protein
MRSKIWLYQTSRAIQAAEQEKMQNELNEFANQWMAHGKSLHAKFWFHNPFLLICEVDESLWGASGCSIDAKVRFLKDLGARSDVDFFVRMKTIVRDVAGNFSQMDFTSVNQLSDSAQVFNPSVASSIEMDKLFTSVKNSPMKRLFA